MLRHDPTGCYGAPNAGALSRETFTDTKVFAGFNLNLGVFNIDVEADRTGNITSGGMKFGWRF